MPASYLKAVFLKAVFYSNQNDNSFISHFFPSSFASFLSIKHQLSNPFTFLLHLTFTHWFLYSFFSLSISNLILSFISPLLPVTAHNLLKMTRIVLATFVADAAPFNENKACWGSGWFTWRFHDWMLRIRRYTTSYLSCYCASLFRDTLFASNKTAA